MGLNAKQWGAILIATLFGLSFIGYIGIGGGPDAQAASTVSSDSTIEYNGFSFTQVDGYWATDYNNQVLYFVNPPTALESFETPNNAAEIITNSKVYIGYDPNQEIDLSSLQSRAYSFFSYFNIQSYLACTHEENCPDIPIIDCSEDHAIIFLQDTETTIIKAEENCLELHALNTDTMQRQLERILYSTLGIME